MQEPAVAAHEAPCVLSDGDARQDDGARRDQLLFMRERPSLIEICRRSQHVRPGARRVEDRQHAAEPHHVSHRFGGRGVYFADPGGNNLELLTRSMPLPATSEA